MRFVNVLKYSLAHATIAVLGCELGTLFLIGEFGGSKLGLVGLMAGWPAVIAAGMFTEWMRIKSN
jgi:hypothetical protein